MATNKKRVCQLNDFIYIRILVEVDLNFIWAHALRFFSRHVDFYHILFIYIYFLVHRRRRRRRRSLRFHQHFV